MGHAVQDEIQNKIRMVDDGIEALRLRIEMIRRAKSTIDGEYFIYNIDPAGRIITKELIAAAHRGVPVRLLIDKSQPIFEKASKVDRQRIVSSPSIVDRPAADRLMDLILSHGAKINLYTNSLGPTDAIYIASQIYLGLKRLIGTATPNRFMILMPLEFER